MALRQGEAVFRREVERRSLETAMAINDLITRMDSTGVINVKDYGAIGDGVADDTVAIREAYRVGSQNRSDAGYGGVTLYFPAGTYLITDTLLMDVHRTHVRGEGVATSIFRFNPASAASCLKFELAGTTGSSPLFGCTVSGLMFTSTNTVTKRAIELVDCSTTVIDRVTVSDSWPTGDSVGLWTRGRELLTVRNFTSTADRPIHISANPYALADTIYSVDHFHFSDCWLVGASASEYNVTIDTGCQVNALTFDGFQSWNTGLGGLIWDDSTSTTYSTQLRIANVRLEQSAVGGYLAYLKHNLGLVQVIIENCLGQSGARAGIYLEHVVQVRIADIWFESMDAGQNAIEIGANCGEILLHNIRRGLATIETGAYNVAVWVEGSGGRSVTLAVISTGAIEVDGGALTGTTLAANIVASSLESVGSSLTIYNPSAANGVWTTHITNAVGTDATLGTLRCNLLLYPSATGSAREALLQCADDVDYRKINILGSEVAINTVSSGPTKLGGALHIAGASNYVDDAAAAAGGVAVGQVYRNGSVLMIRVA